MSDEIPLDAQGVQKLGHLHARVIKEFDELVAYSVRVQTKRLAEEVRSKVESSSNLMNDYHRENVKLREILTDVYTAGGMMPEDIIRVRDFLDIDALPEPLR